MRRFLLAAAAIALIGGAAPFAVKAQTTPTHTTGTFKTPQNLSPLAAGLKQIATIGTTAVYGSVDFEPFDAGRNQTTTLLCGGVTYPPQKVRAWLKGDGTAIASDGVTAGVDLIPNAGCQPTGAVYRATIYFPPSADGRIASVTVTQLKTIPAQASVDWGSLSLAALTSTAFSYVTQSAGEVLDYTLWDGITAPANPAAGKAATWFDITTGKFKCKTSTAADCNPASTGAGSQHQVNGVNVLSNDPINFQNGTLISFSNPSLGNVTATLGVVDIAHGGLNNSATPANGQVPIYDVPTGKYIPGDPIVSGPAAEGALPANNPVWISGKGADGFIHAIRVANDGTVRTDPTGTTTQPVSGTLTANLGTLNGAALDASVTGLEVAQGSATAGQKGALVHGAVTTAAPTYTTGQTSPLSLTTAGGLRVDGSGVTQPVSGTVTANAGTGTFNIQANASVNVAQIGGAATLTGNGVTGTGSPRVTIASDQTAFSINAIESGTWTVQPGNTANTTPWLVTDSADMSGTTPGAAPSKTAIAGGIFNSAAPAPTTGQTLPLQLDSSGNLKVNIQSGGGTGGTASSFGAAFPSTGTAIGAKNGLNMVNLAADASSNLLVNCAVGCSASGAADTVGTTGALNALNATASVALAGDGGAGLFLAAGTLVGTVVPEISYDGGTTWVSSLFYDPAAQTTSASVVFASANGATTRSLLVAGGASNVRVRISAFTSGTANATLRATANAGSLVVNQGNAPWSVNGTVTANAGTGTFNIQANASVNVAQINGVALGSPSAYGTSPGAVNVQGVNAFITNTPTVTANVGTTNGLALDASVTGLEVAQGSTTAAQKGILGLAAVTTAAPVYTTAQSSPLSLNTSGGLRVDGSGVTQPVSAASLPLPTGAATSANQPTLLADNGAAAATNRTGTLPAISRTNFPAAATAGRDAALNTNLHGGLRVTELPDTDVTTYSANKLGLAPAATPTDIAVLPGNATNTVIVTRVQVTCTQTTAGIIDLQLIKRSAADTLGTSAAMTIVPLDSANAAAVSAPLTYTANPTTGTAVGNVDSAKLGCMAGATATPSDIYIWKPGMGQSIVLRGAAQQLAVNLNGVTVTGGSFNVTFQWIETTGL